MSYEKSPFDELSDAISPAVRQLKDIQIGLLGTRSAVVRVTEVSEDLFGDKTMCYSGQVISNVVIRYPFSNIEIFSANDTGSLDDTAIDLFDLLPINMVIPFDSYSSGLVGSPDISSDPIELDKNDIIVDVLYDDNGNPIPLKMKVARMYGGFFGRNQTTRRYELNLIRGDMEDGIQDIIDAYISGEATQS